MYDITVFGLTMGLLLAGATAWGILVVTLTAAVAKTLAVDIQAEKARRLAVEKRSGFPWSNHQ